MEKLVRILTGVAFICSSQVAVCAQSVWQMQPVPVETRWAKEVSPTNVLPQYPRPEMVRLKWQNLNGLWDYAITAKDAGQPAAFDGQILVPYPIESALSGVKKALLPNQRLWYRRNVTRPDLKKDERVLLHFGAVDWQAAVYVNGKGMGEHQGGYESFSFDITDALKSGKNELEVSVWDPTSQGPNPHGKQTLHPQGIQYTASSGIWQTVWLETVPSVSIASLELTSDVDAGVLRVTEHTSQSADGYTVQVSVKSGSDVVGSISGKPGEVLRLAVPHAHLWSPHDPFLYDLSVQLLKQGKVVDKVGSYFGMRKIEIKKDAAGVDRIFLNDKYTYNLGVLDQGYWPDGLYTAPTDEALQFDIAAMKSLGFNTIRKHIKVEPDRWYYWCDKLGMMVWQDMPQPANDTAEARQEFETESAQNIAQLYNHPSIVTWVLFNEGWGAYDQERLAKWMKQLDPTRLLDGHTGGYVNNSAPGEDPSSKWTFSDMTDIHSYPDPKTPPEEPGKARVLGEFGGVGAKVWGHQWNDIDGNSYVMVVPGELLAKYTALLQQLQALEQQGLSASIYTEPYDVEAEENGLLTYDRKVLKTSFKDLQRMNATLTQSASADVAALGALPVAEPNPERQYEMLAATHQNVKLDAASLRELALLANSFKHHDISEQAANEYFDAVPSEERFSTANIKFFQLTTRSATDKAFALFYNNGEHIDQAMRGEFAKPFVDYIIAKEEIDARLFPEGKLRAKDDPWAPNWDEITSNITRKYNAAYADRTVSGAKVRWYRYKKDWPDYVKSLIYNVNHYTPAHFGIGGPDFYFNNNAWDIFQYSGKADELATAISWAQLALQSAPDDYAAMDTYSNLLYKTGNTPDAIKWEEWAVKNAREQKATELTVLQENLSKMKKGQPTWPKTAQSN